MSQSGLAAHLEFDEEMEVIPGEGVKLGKKRDLQVTEGFGQRKLRLGQSYFRDAVLNNFGGRCGITGMPVRKLLVASHIVPWSGDVSERLNVRNGISLSSLYDAAFDKGYIRFDDDYRLLLSPYLIKLTEEKSVVETFLELAGEQLHFPAEAVLCLILRF